MSFEETGAEAGLASSILPTSSTSKQKSSFRDFVHRVSPSIQAQAALERKNQNSVRNYT